MHDSLDIVSLWAPHIPSLIESLHTEIETVYLPRLRAQEEMKPVGISVLHTQSVSTLFDICNQHVTLFKVCAHRQPPRPAPLSLSCLLLFLAVHVHTNRSTAQAIARCTQP